MKKNYDAQDDVRVSFSSQGRNTQSHAFSYTRRCVPTFNAAAFVGLFPFSSQPWIAISGCRVTHSPMFFHVDDDDLPCAASSLAASSIRARSSSKMKCFLLLPGPATVMVSGD